MQKHVKIFMKHYGYGEQDVYNMLISILLISIGCVTTLVTCKQKHYELQKL